ncbi:MAG TPA: SDR family NAD(P)-dependent oxidoreductase [Mycobacteriales bacterium]|nr:SDR family NAD(P)-dependent oxidoreductase [Mycobacteriales bacterium]
MADDGRPLHVVVTGAGRGIGRATAARLAAAGAFVSAADIDLDVVTATAQALGPRVLPYHLDVTDEASWRRLLDDVVTTRGSIDVLVNNAGVMPLGAFAAEDLVVGRQTVDVDLWGVIVGTRLVLPAMLAAGAGHVINVASAMADIATPGAAVYGAAKRAVVAFTEAVALETAGTGVGFSVVLPAVVRTELSGGVPAGGGVPWVDAEDVAAAIVATVAQPRPLVYVPAWVRHFRRLEPLVPRPMLRAALRAARHDRVLTEMAAADRAQYDARLRRQREHSA